MMLSFKKFFMSTCFVFAMCVSSVVAQNLVYKRNALGGTDIYERGKEAYGRIGHISKNAFGETVVEDLRPAQKQQNQTNATFPTQHLYSPDWNFLQQVMAAASSQQRMSSSSSSPNVGSQPESLMEKHQRETSAKLRAQPAQFKNFYSSYLSKPATVKDGWHKVVRITRGKDGEEVCRFGFLKVADNKPIHYLEQYADDLKNTSVAYSVLDESLVKQPIVNCRSFVLNKENVNIPEELLFIDYLVSSSAGQDLHFKVIELVVPKGGGLVLKHSNGTSDVFSEQDGFISENEIKLYFLVETGNYSYVYLSYGTGAKSIKGTFSVIYDENKEPIYIR